MSEGESNKVSGTAWNESNDPTDPLWSQSYDDTQMCFQSYWFNPILYLNVPFNPIQSNNQRDAINKWYSQNTNTITNIKH